MTPEYLFCDKAANAMAQWNKLSFVLVKPDELCEFLYNLEQGVSEYSVAKT